MLYQKKFSYHMILILLSHSSSMHALHSKYKLRYTETGTMLKDYTQAYTLGQPAQDTAKKTINALAHRESSIQNVDETPWLMLKALFSRPEIIAPLVVATIYCGISLAIIIHHKRKIKVLQKEFDSLHKKLTDLDKEMLTLTGMICNRNKISEAALRTHITSFLFEQVPLVKIEPDENTPALSATQRKPNKPIFKKKWQKEEQERIDTLQQQRSVLQKEIDDATARLKQTMHTYYQDKLMPIIVITTIVAVTFVAMQGLKEYEIRQVNKLQKELVQLLQAPA